MKRLRSFKYTDDEILSMASKYMYPTELLSNNPSLYRLLVKRKLTERVKYLYGRIGSKLKRLVYVYEFEDNHFYVGITYNEIKRHNEHSINGRTSVSKHMLKTGLSPIKKILSKGYIDAEDARLLEESKRVEYINNGWISLNKKRAGDLGTTEIKWNKDKIIESISVCSSREEIKDKFGNGLINAAKKLGIYELLTKDIPYQLNYYTKEQCFELVKKYRIIEEFRKDYGALYVTICKNKWNNEMFTHMISGKCDFILDKTSGIYYYGTQDAVDYSGVNLKLGGLRSQLKGRTKNKTNLIIV